jgi:CRISPR/Cas system-associated protein Cas7 (RAMP superfamily)
MSPEGVTHVGTRRKRSVAAVLALVLLLSGGVAGAAANRDPFDAMVVDRVAEPAPAPGVVFRTLDGREARVDGLRGKLVLLGFFTTW